MVSDWTTNKKLIKKWLEAIGDEQHPLGDIHREAVINPTILSMLLCVSLENFPEEAGFWNPLSLTEKLASSTEESQSRPGKRVDEAIRDWYNRLSDEKPLRLLKGKNILDLGAGEGYLGRWLNSFGMNYCGVDVSKALVDEGNARYNSLKKKKRVSADARYKLLVGDLEDPDCGFLGTNDDILPPDFVLFNCCLEHIAQPQLIIQTLANYLVEHGTDARVLLSVSNPDYHLSNGLNDVSCYNKENQVRIASIDEEVSVVTRPWFDYVRMFRAGHFRCERLFLSHFPSSVAKVIPHLIDQNLVDIAPFYFFQFRLHSHNMADPNEDNIRSAIDSSLLNCASPQQKQQLLQNRDRCKVYSFPPNASMFEKHDLAGHLWIVLDGSAKLRDTDIKFVRGESIGELEIGSEQDQTPVFFRYSCHAGPEGCTVLNISPDVISNMMQSETNISSGLFSQISKKLRSQVWLWNLPLTKLAGSEIMKDHAGYLPKFAAALVWSCQLAADFENRSVLPGDTAFLSLEEIRKKVFPSLKEDPDELRGACYVLVGLGIVDAFPGEYLRESSKDPGKIADRLNLFQGIVIDNAVRTYVQCVKGHPRDRIATKLKGIIGFDKKLWLNNLRSAVFAEEFDFGVTVTLHNIARQQDIDFTLLKDQVDRAYGYLGHVSRWLFEGTPSFFVVREPQLLRAIAVAEREVAPMLESRARVLGIRQFTRKSVIDAAKVERLMRYISLFEKFVLRDLQSARQNLHFTGAPERNHSSEMLEREKRSKKFKDDNEINDYGEDDPDSLDDDRI